MLLHQETSKSALAVSLKLVAGANYGNRAKILRQFLTYFCEQGLGGLKM